MKRLELLESVLNNRKEINNKSESLFRALEKYASKKSPYYSHYKVSSKFKKLSSCS